jgi:hypothetical protein
MRSPCSETNESFLNFITLSGINRHRPALSIWGSWQSNRIFPISDFRSAFVQLQNPSNQVVLHTLRNLDLIKLAAPDRPLPRIVNQYVPVDIGSLRLHSSL